MDKEIELNNDELEIFYSNPRVILVLGLNKKKSFLDSDNVFNEILKYKKEILRLKGLLKPEKHG